MASEDRSSPRFGSPEGIASLVDDKRWALWPAVHSFEVES